MDLVERKRNNKEIVSTWHSRSRDKWPDLQFPLSLQFAPVAKVRWVWTKLTFSKYHNCPTTGIWSIIVLPASPVGSSLPKAPCKITLQGKNKYRGNPSIMRQNAKQSKESRQKQEKVHIMTSVSMGPGAIQFIRMPCLNADESIEKLILKEKNISRGVGAGNVPAPLSPKWLHHGLHTRLSTGAGNNETRALNKK